VTKSKLNKTRCREIYETWLCVNYPQCFEKTRPLQKQFFQAVADGLPEDITRTQLRKSLEWYCTSIAYHESFGEYDFRTNADGSEGEAITIEDRAYAQRELTDSLARIAASKERSLAEKKKEKRARQDAFYKKQAKEKRKAKAASIKKEDQEG